MDNIHAIRSEFEQSALPKAFCGKRAALLSALMQRKEMFIWDFYKQMERKEENYRCPYTPKDFSVSFWEFKEAPYSVLIVRIEMPQPAQKSDCHTAYLCFGNGSSCDLYIAAELSDTGNLAIYKWQGLEQKVLIGTSEGTELDQVLATYWEVNDDHAKF